MRLAIIVLAHCHPGQVGRLLRMVTHPQTSVYLHVDKHVPLPPFIRAAADLEVRLLPRHRSRWGTIGCVDAALEGLRAARGDSCDYFILISGQDFPLKPIGEIVRFFEAAGDRSYLLHTPINDVPHKYRGRDRTEFYTYTVLGRREICIPRGEDTSYFNWKGRTLNTALRLWSSPRGVRRFPPYLEAFYGHTWWNMSRPAADYVLRFVQAHPDYRRYHRYTRVPDEIFFTSILAGSGYRGEMANDSLRYFRWGSGLHPVTLTVDDLPTMLASGKLFARKFDATVDHEVLDRITNHLTAAGSRASGADTDVRGAQGGDPCNKRPADRQLREPPSAPSDRLG